MKNLTLSSLALVFILFFFSCKKDDSASASVSSTRPKTYTENVTSSITGNSITTFDLSYDNNNRLTGMVSTPAPPALKTVYQYSTSSFTLDLYNYNVLSIHENFWLNSIPFVDSTLQYDDTQDTSTEKYIYNSNKQLIQMNEYYYTTASGGVLSNTTYYTYDNNGNVITQTDDFSTITYDYYPDLLTSFSLDMAYFPVPKNLPKTLTVTSGGSTDTATHTYAFDSNNRLITDKIVASNGDIIIKSYTY